MKKLLVALMLLLAPMQAGADLTVICTTPTTNSDGSALTDLAGIYIYFRTASTPTYPAAPTATIVTSTTNTDVSYKLVTAQTVTYCAIAYAYDTSGNLSGPSNEVCKKNEDKLAPSAPATRIISLILTPTTFATTTVGIQRYKSVKVINSGEINLTITNVSLMGPDNDFRLAAYTLPKTLSVNASASYRIYFKPEVIGNRYNIMRFTTNLGEQDIPISGIGL
jgi:hypothetical protein